MHRFLRIESGVLKECWIPKTLVLPPDITRIEDNAFLGCDGLVEVIISEGVTSIGRWAFWSCESLTSITIPKSVISIGNNAFKDCSRLTSIRLPERFDSPSERKRLGLVEKRKSADCYYQLVTVNWLHGDSSGEVRGEARRGDGAD